MDVDIRTIHATGGASVNRAILQVMADVFGADVFRFETRNSACLGAALRAFHADAQSDGRSVAWEEVVRGLAEPVAASRVRPDRSNHIVYRGLVERYAAFEAEALRGAGAGGP